MSPTVFLGYTSCLLSCRISIVIIICHFIVHIKVCSVYDKEETMLWQTLMTAHLLVTEIYLNLQIMLQSQNRSRSETVLASKVDFTVYCRTSGHKRL